jgi:hypothetical protein
MSRVIVLINSCLDDRLNDRQQVCRDTWAKHGRVNYRFVLGRCNCSPADDEIVVDAGDRYEDMPDKHRRGYRWALAHGYDYVFQVCTDTYVAQPHHLLERFGGYEYAGYKVEHDYYASGGCGFWLGPNALELLSGSVPTSTIYGDQWVGEILSTCMIPLHHDPNFWPDKPFPGVWDKPYIGVHLSRGTGNFDPEWMRECHKSFLESAHV